MAVLAPCVAASADAFPGMQPMRAVWYRALKASGLVNLEGHADFDITWSWLRPGSAVIHGRAP